MNKQEPTPAGALDAMAARTRGSAVYDWLSKHHDALAPTLNTTPSWSSLAAYLGDCGFVGADGQPPTAAAVRGSWGRVAARAKRKG
jgi:hypothetical protein